MKYDCRYKTPPHAYNRGRDLYKILNAPVAAQHDFTAYGTKELIRMIDGELLAELKKKKTNHWRYCKNRQIRLQEARVGEMKYLKWLNK